MSRLLSFLPTIKLRLSSWIYRRLDFFTPRRTVNVAAGLLAAFAVVVVLTARAQAQSGVVGAVADTAVTIVVSIINALLVAVIQTLGQITSMVVSLLVLIAGYNRFSTVNVVDIGWTIVKDVSNMLFIIALLVIAAGTVLRLENYRYNRLLSNLIIMAFLTNFSKFIAAFFIQGAQVLMLTFVNAFRESLFGNFVSMFGLDKVLRFSETTSGSALDSLSIFANLLAGLILVVIATVVTAAILVVLVVRIVALWILVILSPLAFATQILPNTKSFASRWWSEFGKYVTQGPILAFFLWLALAIVSVGQGATKIDEGFGDILTQLRPPEGNFFTIAAFDFDNLITFVISATFLMFGLQYATSSSGVAGKWAGKVATAGFAGAAAASGLNAIRDRTVAPVQGWIRNRGAARQAAIQERTQTLEAAGDRVRASLPVATIPGTSRIPGLRNIGLTQAGKEKAQAAANAFERQRTTRTAQARGMTDWTTDALHNSMQNSRDQRERLAAMQTLQQRGALKLGDPDQRQAYNDVIDNQRIPAGDRIKLREDIMSNYAKGLNEDAAQKEYDQANASGNKDERIIFARRLQEVNALKARNPKHEQVISQMQLDLADAPDKLRGFEESLMKTNPAMAKRVLFHDLKDANDRRNLLLAVQQKQISASILDKDTQKKFADAGPAGKADISKFLIDNSPDAATLRGYKNQMDPEAFKEIFKHLDMKDETSDDRRAMVASETGEWGKAFTNTVGWMTEKRAALDEDGNAKIDAASGQPIMEDVGVAKAYMDKLGGDELSKNLSLDAGRDVKVLKALYNSKNMTFPHWDALRQKSSEMQGALTEGFTAYADELAKSSPGGKLALGPGNKENNFVAKSLALASKGKELRYDLDEIPDQREFEGLIRSGKALDLKDLDKSTAYTKGGKAKYINETFGITADTAKIADMVQFGNFDFADASLAAAQTELQKRMADTAKSKEERMKAYSRLHQMALAPVLSNYIGMPDKPEIKGDKKEEERGGPSVVVTPGAGETGKKKRTRKAQERDEDDEDDKGPDEPPPSSGTPTPGGPKPLPDSGAGGSGSSSAPKNVDSPQLQQQREIAHTEAREYLYGRGATLMYIDPKKDPSTSAQFQAHQDSVFDANKLLYERLQQVSVARSSGAIESDWRAKRIVDGKVEVEKFTSDKSGKKDGSRIKKIISLEEFKKHNQSLTLPQQEVLDQAIQEERKMMDFMTGVTYKYAQGNLEATRPTTSPETPRSPGTPPAAPTGPSTAKSQPSDRVKAATPSKATSVDEPPASTAAPEPGPRTESPAPLSSYGGGTREPVRDVSVDIDETLSRLATAGAKDMASFLTGIQTIFERGVQSLERGNDKNASTMRKQFDHLSRGGASGADHYETKRIYKEFGEALKRLLSKKGSDSEPQEPDSTNSEDT